MQDAGILGILKTRMKEFLFNKDYLTMIFSQTKDIKAGV